MSETWYVCRPRGRVDVKRLCIECQPCCFTLGVEKVKEESVERRKDGQIEMGQWI